MHVIKRTVQFGDCDPAGYIYTPRMSYFVVEAVTEYLSYLLGEPALRMIFNLGVLPLTRALSIEFTGPAKWDDVLDIKISVTNVSESSFSLGLEAVNTSNAENVVVFTASQTQVCISSETKLTVEIPEILKNSLLEELKA